jgi:hypothetical protein
MHSRENCNRVALRLLVPLTIAAVALLHYAGCAERTGRGPTARTASAASAYVASLGNLRTGHSPSTAQTELATFLFGVEPDPPLGLVKPMHVTATGGEVWISDGALQAVLAWKPDRSALQAAALVDPPAGATAMTTDASGGRLIAGENGVVVRYSAQGSAIRR